MCGLIHLYTGDGKGKTTAAVGLTIRAVGNNLKVLFVQFIKGNFTGELSVLKKFPELIDIIRCSTGFIYGKPKPHQREEIKRCLKEIKVKIRDCKYDVVVFDEMAIAISLDLISKEETEEILALIGDSAEIIITGRGAPQWLIERADLVTEMRKIKHYFDRGILARKGIEY